MAKDSMSGNCQETRKPRCCLGLLALIAAMALSAAPSSVAAAAESGTGSTAGETAAESPVDSPEPAPAAPAAPATGWAPAGAGPETSGGEASEAQRGSSLGSGGAPQPSAPANPQPSAAAPSRNPGASAGAEPASTDLSGYYESEPAGAATDEGDVSATPTGVSGDPVKAVAASPRPVHLGAAAALAHSEPHPADSAAPPETAPSQPASHDDRTAPAETLPLAVLIVAALVLAVAGAVAARRWLRHRRRGQLEALWARRQSDWDAAVSQIRLERAPGHNAGH